MSALRDVSLVGCQSRNVNICGMYFPHGDKARNPLSEETLGNKPSFVTSYGILPTPQTQAIPDVLPPSRGERRGARVCLWQPVLSNLRSKCVLLTPKMIQLDISLGRQPW